MFLTAVVGLLLRYIVALSEVLYVVAMSLNGSYHIHLDI